MRASHSTWFDESVSFRYLIVSFIMKFWCKSKVGWGARFCLLLFLYMFASILTLIPQVLEALGPRYAHIELAKIQKKALDYVKLITYVYNNTRTTIPALFWVAGCFIFSCMLYTAKSSCKIFNVIILCKPCFSLSHPLLLTARHVRPFTRWYVGCIFLFCCFFFVLIFSSFCEQTGWKFVDFVRK